MAASIFALVAALAACQSVLKRDVNLVKDRVEKLRPMSRFQSVTCKVSARLTEPAMARFRQMFPDEAKQLEGQRLEYSWYAREDRCEIKWLSATRIGEVPGEDTARAGKRKSQELNSGSETVKSHRSLMEAAFCMLLQTHWVNSPFDDLVVKPDDIVRSGESVQIHTSPDPLLGIYLDVNRFEITTRTKSRGILRALYKEFGTGVWLPERIEQTTGTTVIVVDTFEYATATSGLSRRLQSLWVSAGQAEEVVAYTHAEVSDCER